MSKFKEKSPIFLLGFLFGLTFAGAFFILKLDDYFKELSIYKNVTESISSSFGNSDGNIDANNNSENKILTKQKKVKPEINNNEASVNSKSNYKNTDSLKTNTSADSLPFMAVNLQNDEIIIKKDELLSSVVLNLNFIGSANKITAKDSLLAKVSGVENDVHPKMMSVEFWKSPLNFKGYKMSKYKLILFGLTSTDDAKLYKLNDLIYLRIDKKIYQLDYTGEFEAYKQITDETIVSKLK